MSQIANKKEGCPSPEEIMKFMDANGDGQVCWNEYGAALEKLCKKHNYEPKPWDYATATALFIYTDTDGSGTVSFKELETMYNHIKAAAAAKK